MRKRSGYWRLAANFDGWTAAIERGLTEAGAMPGRRAKGTNDRENSTLQEIANTSTPPSTPEVSQAAAEQTTADQAVVNATFLLWALSSLVAVPITFYFGLSLPEALGVTAGTVGGLDGFLTAVVIGAGTKPLHDLINVLQKGSQSTGASSMT